MAPAAAEPARTWRREGVFFDTKVQGFFPRGAIGFTFVTLSTRDDLGVDSGPPSSYAATPFSPNVSSRTRHYMMIGDDASIKRNPDHALGRVQRFDGRELCAW